MNISLLQLEWLPGRYAVCRLEPTDAVPAWAHAEPGVTTGNDAQAGPQVAPATAGPGRFMSITRTDHELSIVIDEKVVPQSVKAERGFFAMRLVGQIDMASIGIFAKLTGALATARVPVFVISTFDTDYLMVRDKFRADAIIALSSIATFI